MSKPAAILTAEEAKTRFSSNLTNLFDVVALAASDLKSRGCDVVNPTMIKLAKTGVIEIAKIKNADIPLVFLKASYPYWDKIYDEDIEFVEKNLFKMVLPNEVDDSKSKEIYDICRDITSKILGVKDGQGNYLIKSEYIKRIGVLLRGMVSLSVKYVFFLQKPTGCINRDGKYKWTFSRELDELSDLDDFDLNHMIRKYDIKGLPTSF